MCGRLCACLCACAIISVRSTCFRIIGRVCLWCAVFCARAFVAVFLAFVLFVADVVCSQRLAVFACIDYFFGFCGLPFIFITGESKDNPVSTSAVLLS